MQGEYVPIFFAATRIFGFMLLLPLDGISFQLGIRLGFACSMGYLMGSSLPSMELELSLLPFELLIGFIIGLPFALLLHLVSWWAELIEGGRGQSLSSILDPLFSQHSVALSSLVNQGTFLFCILSPIFLRLLGSCIESFSTLPPGAFGALQVMAYFQKLSIIITRLLTIVGTMALPFLFVCLCVEIIFAFAHKILPGISLQSECFLVKSIIVFGALLYIYESGIASTLAEVLMVNRIM